MMSHVHSEPGGSWWTVAYPVAGGRHDESATPYRNQTIQSICIYFKNNPAKFQSEVMKTGFIFEEVATTRTTSNNIL